VLEQTLVNDGMISFPLSLLHTVVETVHPYNWTRLAMVLKVSSQSLLIQFKIGRSSFFFRLADLTQ
jgi:hypothetical protein